MKEDMKWVLQDAQPAVTAQEMKLQGRRDTPFFSGYYWAVLISLNNRNLLPVFLSSK